MKYTTADYKAVVTTGTAPQDFIITRYVNSKMVGLFSAADGDFTADPITLEQHICQDEDLRFGEVTADALSFTLINHQKALSDFPWGDMIAYIGVGVSETDLSLPDDDVLSCIGTTYYGRSDGVYKGSTRIYDSNGIPITGLIRDYFGGRIIALGNGVCVSIDSSTDVATAMTPCRHLAQKMLYGCSLDFYQYDDGTGKVFRMDRYELFDGIAHRITYELVNLGCFTVNRPDSLQTQTVRVNDANNVLAHLDVDASSYLSGITYPITLQNLAAGALAYTQVPYDFNVGTWSDSITASPFGDGKYTVRKILAYCCERTGTIPVMDGIWNGDAFITHIRFKRVCDSVANYVETIGWDRIEADTLSVKDYSTQGIGKIQIIKNDGTTVEDAFAPTEPGVYQIIDNPLVTATNSDLENSAGSNGFVFRPTTAEVDFADPAVELGDMVHIKVAENDTEPEYDVYGNPTGGTVTNYPVVMPLMSRVIQWMGNTFATYSSTGLKERAVDSAAASYRNASTMKYAVDVVQSGIGGYDDALNQQAVFNKLTNNGAAQGIFLDANGNLYINGTWMQTNTLVADALKTSDGQNWLNVFNNYVLSLARSSGDYLRLGDWKVYASESTSVLVNNYINFSPNSMSGLSFTVRPSGGSVTLKDGGASDTAVITFGGVRVGSEIKKYALTLDHGFVEIN